VELELEKRLSRQSDRGLEDGREDRIDTPGDAGDLSARAELDSVIVDVT